MESDTLNYSSDKIEVIYYFDKDLGLCPVKKYLKQYTFKPKDKHKQRDRKIKILADIHARIKYIRDNKGIAVPPIAKPLHGYSFSEIKKAKDKNTVIRILWFYDEGKIVLLDAFEKPSHYTKNREKREVEKNYKRANKYYNKFKLNPKSYEEYK